MWWKTQYAWQRWHADSICTWMTPFNSSILQFIMRLKLHRAFNIPLYCDNKTVVKQRCVCRLKFNCLFAWLHPHVHIWQSRNPLSISEIKYVRVDIAKSGLYFLLGQHQSHCKLNIGNALAQMKWPVRWIYMRKYLWLAYKIGLFINLLIWETSCNLIQHECHSQL